MKEYEALVILNSKKNSNLVGAYVTRNENISDLVLNFIKKKWIVYRTRDYRKGDYYIGFFSIKGRGVKIKNNRDFIEELEAFECRVEMTKNREKFEQTREIVEVENQHRDHLPLLKVDGDRFEWLIKEYKNKIKD